eukprot:jgi/Picsp_1/1337/NSC_04817-R1_calcitonin gene-related peptide-receptor component protein
MGDSATHMYTYTIDNGAGEETYLTNAEVLSLLDEKREEGSASERLDSSEETVRKSLVACGTVKRSRLELEERIKALKKHDLTRIEVLQLLNHSPSSILEAFLCVEQAILDSRVTEEELEEIVRAVKD